MKTMKLNSESSHASLSKINSIVNFLRGRGLNYKQIQAYFVKKFEWSNEQFETMMYVLDTRGFE